MKGSKIVEAQLRRAQLQTEFNNVAEAYTEAFIEKHEYESYDREMWVACRIGGIIAIGDMFVSFDDIRWDIDTDQPVEKFGKWYWNALECHEIGLDYPNYENFTKGAPVPTLETIDKVKSLRKELFNLTGKQVTVL